LDEEKDARGELRDYILLSFLFSWIVTVPLAASHTGLLAVALPRSLSFLASFGPSLAAVTITYRDGGVSRVRRLLTGLFRWRVNLVWYAVTLFGPATAGAAAILLEAWLRGGPAISMVEGVWPGILPVFLLVLLLGGPLGEETGWRGYALPRLLKRHDPTVSSLLIGVAWWAWHLPLFWVEGSPQSELPLLGFMAQILGTSIIYTWIYRGTGGSVLLPMLFHASGNTAAGFMPFLPLEQTGGSTTAFRLFLLIIWAAASAITLHEASKPRVRASPSPGSQVCSWCRPG
jgi:hypothetical protein